MKLLFLQETTMLGRSIFIFGLCAAFALDNPMEDPKLFEGDMILTEDQKRGLEVGGLDPNIPLAAIKTNLWPLTVPYEISSSLANEDQAVAAIDNAIYDYHNHTCLRFKKRRTESNGYISFYRGGGCSSYVGYSRSRVNRISLARGCWYKGTVIHEIAHSLGFYHEQSRPDRDEYVEIIWGNIHQSSRHNFKKQKSDNIDSLNVPYDYESVMHYGKTAFGGGKLTIKTKDPAMQDVIGNRKGFSDLDIKQMNLLYKCSGVKPSTPSPTRPPSCYDERNKCPEWAKKKYCTEGKYVDFMKMNCKKSCGLCKGPATQSPTAPPPTNPPTDCNDFLPWCARNKQFCSDPQGTKWGDYLRKYCRRTCGFCTGGPATAIPPTTLPETTSPPANCEDKKSQCPRWAEVKYCTQGKFVDYMKQFCKKSCGLCGKPGITINPPVVTVGPTFPPGDCGRSYVQSGRVIAGTDAKPGAWPWQVVLLYGNRPNCGGSLVAPHWVVTAAHCVSGRENRPFSYKIRVGEHNTRGSEGTEKDIPVEKIISHPIYSRSTIDSDIALMKLAEPAVLGKYVNTVCLPKHGNHAPVGTECYITGWGKIRHPGSMHNILQQAKMPVVSKQTCTDLNTKKVGVKITDNMICAGHGGSTRVSGCHGDSGGPFVCQTGENGRWELHGAVSWGSGRCDAKSSYTVFARVTALRNWIDQTMQSN